MFSIGFPLVVLGVTGTTFFNDWTNHVWQVGYFAEYFRHHLVGATEADPTKGKISHESPIGKALMDQKVGDVVEAETPGGVIKFKILKIE